jgi:hypothetical protein
MIEALVFYNHFGAGDIFESREFVKDWMETIPAKEYVYCHGKNPKILADIPNLTYHEVVDIMDARQPFVYVTNSDYLMINTWIGRDSKYVLPGIGCVVEMLYQMHNDIRKYIGIPLLKRNVIDYIPDIDYSKYNIDDIDDFMWDTIGKRKVLVSNGPVQSSQAENFDFNPALDTVSDLYPDTLFILTQRMGLAEKKNLLYTDQLIKDPDGFDLNEISYLSTFCDVLIGRNSGPHVFSQVKRNWLDPNKKILSFTYTEIASTFVLDQPTKMKKYWSNRADYQGIVDKIRSVLE